MDPLIITATPNICWLDPDVDYPKTPDAIAEEAYRCHANGATILHTHAEGRWEETVRAVRSMGQMIVQAGMSSLPIPDRMMVFDLQVDMISIILNHHDEAFARTECLVLHPRDELLEYARLCATYRVIPEFEVWHSGSIWNLNFLIERDALKPPYVNTLFFGWPGGTWSPPTIEEYHYRRRQMPPNCVLNVSIMAKEQIDILTAAILAGDHIRVGTEDYPRNLAGETAPTHELVREAADIARAVGRPIATIEQARKMIGQ